MKFLKLTAASIAMLGVFVASPAVQAHASLNTGDTGALPIWTNGVITPWLPSLQQRYLQSVI